MDTQDTKLSVGTGPGQKPSETVPAGPLPFVADFSFREETELKPPPTIQELADLLQHGAVEKFNKLRPETALDFSGHDFSGLTLRGANFSRCNLTQANFSGADLEGADFSSANMLRVDLSHTILNKAKFCFARMGYADLSQIVSADSADFQEAYLVRSDLSGGNFAQAIFCGVRLDFATLSQGHFEYVDFSRGFLVGALLNESKFNHANLNFARLFQSNGKDIDFSDANLCGAEMLKTRYASSDQKRADKSEIRTSFKGAWIHDLVHDGFDTEIDLLHDAISDREPPPGMFPARPKAEQLALLIDGIPGSNREIYDKAWGELQDLIGLEKVKEFVSSQLNMMRFQHARHCRGLKEDDLTLHFVFTGSPGTGKTTVARIMSQLLHSVGYLKKGHIVEVQKADLIAGYQGQTLEKTRGKILEALDGTLFIDEAYALTQNEQDDYAKDAIATLLKIMEDNRNRISVIAAGYSKEMQTFVKANSGLKSRFTVFIDFPDYSNGELTEIMKGMLSKRGYRFTPEFLAAASFFLAVMKEKESANFGNAREVRTMVQKTITRMSNRIVGRYTEPNVLTDLDANDLPFDDLLGFKYSDIPLDQLRWKVGEGEQAKEIGFKDLVVTGKFPELSDESQDIARGFNVIAKAEQIEEAEESLDEIEARVRSRSGVQSHEETSGVVT